MNYNSNKLVHHHHYQKQKQMYPPYMGFLEGKKDLYFEILLILKETILAN
jgi:hypothetical protein